MSYDSRVGIKKRKGLSTSIIINNRDITSPWARGGHRYHQRGPHFNGTMLFRNMNCNYFCLLDIPNW